MHLFLHNFYYCVVGLHILFVSNLDIIDITQYKTGVYGLSVAQSKHRENDQCTDINNNGRWPPIFYTISLCNLS